MSLPRFKLTLRRHEHYIEPTCLELGDMFVPAREVIIDWKTPDKIGEMVIKVGMQYVDIAFEEEKSAVSIEPKEQEASPKTDE